MLCTCLWPSASCSLLRTCLCPSCPAGGFLCVYGWDATGIELQGVRNLWYTPYASCVQ